MIFAAFRTDIYFAGKGIACKAVIWSEPNAAKLNGHSADKFQNFSASFAFYFLIHKKSLLWEDKSSNLRSVAWPCGMSAPIPSPQGEAIGALQALSVGFLLLL